MALTATDWTIDRITGNIRYTGDDHHEASPSYATVIELHRWVQELADDAIATGDDELDITNTDPSRRSTDNIITLINSYNITDTEAEHLYDGSIIQSDGDDIYDGIVNFGNKDVQIQVIQNGAIVTDDFWNYSEGGTHTGSADADILTDSAQSWTADEWVDYIIYNTTDGSRGVVTANDATTITATLEGGTENDWDASDVYLIGKGLNPDATSGISHRFLIQVRDTGTDIDNRKIIGTTRKFGYTYGEFVINATARGNNVLALTDVADLNNETSIDTVSTWSTINNVTEGYNAMDVDNDTNDEYYYSEWDRSSYSINQFYEYMKWLSRDSSVSTIYGLNGELFRGITHQVAISAPSGTFVEPESLSWTGGTGQLLAIDSTTAGTVLYMQLLTGVVPSTQTITGNGGATATSGTVTERTIARPFCGASTGSAIIGSYGFGIEKTDLSSSDKVTDLDNEVITPPNNVTNTVSGLIHGEDRVLVAPWDGTSTDTNGDPAIDKDQFSNTNLLSTDNITSIEVDEAIPADTPSSGYLRVTDVNGFERRLHYSAVNTATKIFTIDTTDGNEDFATVNASIGADIYLAYIDELASGDVINYDSLVEGTAYVIKTVGDVNWTSIGATSGTEGEIFTKTATAATGTTGDAYEQSTTSTYTSVQSGSRSLVVVVRDGATTPIKQFISSWSQTTSNQTITAIRTTDA